jgi:hypothetical protein
MTLSTTDDLANINEQLQQSDSNAEKVGLDVKGVCEKYCIYEHFTLEKNGNLVPVGKQAFSTGDDYEKFYEEPGIEILLSKGEKQVFTLIFRGKDKEEAEEQKGKGISILKDRLGIKSEE